MQPNKLAELRTKGVEYAKNVLSNTIFPLETLGNKEFERAMDTLLQQLTIAWISGYVAALEEGQARLRSKRGVKP